MNQINEIKSYLSDQNRRLGSGKLYNIKDKNGNKIPFIPNQIQEDFLQNIRYKNIILKARQLGITTLINLILLDTCLFGKNKNAGIIAQDLESAERIFYDKIKFAYDNLPTWLREICPMSINRSREIIFQHTGSRISVGTSFRGGTYQYIHISEFGKICNKYPDKAREIITGTLNTVDKNQHIWIESTAEGNSGYFFDMCKQAKSAQEQGKKLTKMDYKFFFYPRFAASEYELDEDVLIDNDMQKYFQKLENQNIILSSKQKAWYLKMSQLQGDDMLREYPCTWSEAFSMAVKGAYYEKEISTVRRQNRITKVKYHENLPVNTARDLGGAGGGDDTAIWFWQRYNNEIRLIDFWAGSGYSMIEIIQEQIKSKPYTYEYHLAPHDIKVHEYSTGKTRFASALEQGIRFTIAPKLSISDGINQVRNMFENCWFDEQSCKIGLNALAGYRRDYDEKNGIFLDRPLHNEFSHAADAFRTLAVGLNLTIDKHYKTEIINYDDMLC